MATRKSIFPYRLLRWFLTKQLVLAGIGMALLGTGLIFWIERSGMSLEEVRISRNAVLISLCCATVVLFVVSLFMARGLVVPLGRLIEKTRRLHRFPFEDDVVPRAELVYDEPGEWYDLERALNELGRDLQSKTIRLSREKTELRTIMSAINEGVLALNQERRPLFYNTQFAMMFRLDGMAVGEMLVGEILRSPDILVAYENCLRDGVIRSVEAQLEPPALGVRTFQVSVAPLRKKHNQEIYGAVAVFHDVTEMKKAESMRIDFVGNVSHELRTPLTSIKGYMQTVIKDVQDGRTEQTLDFLKIVDRNVERLMHLVDDLLDLSSLQSGVELKLTRIDLKALTATVMAQVDSRGHQVEQQFLVDHLLADEQRVEQVLRNLLQNAVRYVPKNGRVQVVWAQGSGGAVLLRVKDNGPGIPKEHQARLFERFYRADEARSRAVGGSGIGLALVKHIMLRHGGCVRVVSEPGQGSDFICEFPLRADK